MAAEPNDPRGHATLRSFSVTPDELTVSNLLDLEELNGFTILDFDRERADVRLERS
jgi:hypothetical protein